MRLVQPHLQRPDRTKRGGEATMLATGQDAPSDLAVDDKYVYYTCAGDIQGGKKAYIHRVPAGETYSRVETPKGELGFYLVSEGGQNAYRYHVRSSSFINLSALKEMTVGYKVADAVVVLGSLDIVLGEVDR